MATPETSLREQSPDENLGKTSTNINPNVSAGSPSKEASLTVAFTCPICEESMITLAQLNRHIDDVHDHKASESIKELDPVKGKLSHLSKSPPHKRMLKLDLHESTSRFSLSINGESSELTDSSRLTRHHWKQASSSRTSYCAEKGCKNVLNVRNGEVNCRKCGKLFCSQHTRYRARLTNGPRDTSLLQPLPVYDSIHGVSVKVCRHCYTEKPNMKAGTRVLSKDLTKTYFSERQKMLQEKDLARSAVRSRFIKLADFHSQKHLWQKQNSSNIFNWNPKSAQFSKESVLEVERDIVGAANWEADAEVSHCKLCFVKFSLLIRKHHCRLCGMVVNDGSYTSDDPSDFCSAQVPLNLLLSKMPSLNYSPIVHDNWGVLVSADKSTSFSLRMCKTCKDLLFHTLSNTTLTDSKEHADVLEAYDQILAIKATIVSSMSRYKTMVREKDEKNNHQTNRLRVRLRKAVKDLEIMVTLFFNRHFAVDPQSNKFVPLHSTKLVTNIYKGSTAYLQESVLELKRINEEFQSSENKKLAGQLGAITSADGTPQSSFSASLSPTSNPRLTKKEIRELREQLMVTNEQKFIVESLMEDLKRERKFDELVTLEENRVELATKITELTNELGEFGF